MMTLLIAISRSSLTSTLHDLPCCCRSVTRWLDLQMRRFADHSWNHTWECMIIIFIYNSSIVVAKLLKKIKLAVRECWLLLCSSDLVTKIRSDTSPVLSFDDGLSRSGCFWLCCYRRIAVFSYPERQRLPNICCVSSSDNLQHKEKKEIVYWHD